MKQHFYKLAMITILGSGFALAQSMPQQTSPQSSPAQPQTQQQPSTVPDQGRNPATPETLPNTDQQKPSDQQKLPQSDAAPASTGDVQSTIQSALQKDPSLANANISVDVKNGKSVELSGTVPSKDAKEAAERIAKENAGGLKIKNHIKVASAEKPADKSNPPMENPK